MSLVRARLRLGLGGLSPSKLLLRQWPTPTRRHATGGAHARRADVRALHTTPSARSIAPDAGAASVSPSSGAGAASSPTAGVAEPTDAEPTNAAHGEKPNKMHKPCPLCGGPHRFWACEKSFKQLRRKAREQALLQQQQQATSPPPSTSTTSEPASARPHDTPTDGEATTAAADKLEMIVQCLFCGKQHLPWQCQPSKDHLAKKVRRAKEQQEKREQRQQQQQATTSPSPSTAPVRPSAQAQRAKHQTAASPSAGVSSIVAPLGAVYNALPSPNRSKKDVGRVVKSFVAPPYVPPLTKAELAARQPTFVQMVKTAAREYVESATWKLAHPLETARDLATTLFQPIVLFPNSLALKHQYRRFLEGWGWTHFEPPPPRKSALEFTRETDLSQFVLLNDAPFGGSSESSLELREYPSEKPGGPKRYTVVFKGYLRNMKPFSTSGSKWMEDAGRPAVLTQQEKKDIEDKETERKEKMKGIVPAQLGRAPPKKGQTATPEAEAAAAAAPTGSKKQSKKLGSTLSSVAAATHSPTASSPSSSPSSAPGVGPSGSSASPLSSAPPLLGHGLINGFAAFISPLFAYPDLDLDRYDFLSMHVRTDGRPYIFNVRCRDGISSGHGFVYQARVTNEVPRPIHKLEIRFENMLCTQNGRMRTFATTLPKDRIESFGFSVSGESGPFEFELEWIAGETGVPVFEQKMHATQAQKDLEEKTARTQKRMADLTKRQQVQAEMRRLRVERGEAPEGDKSMVEMLAAKFVGTPTPNQTATPTEEAETAPAVAPAVAATVAVASPSAPTSRPTPSPKQAEMPRVHAKREGAEPESPVDASAFPIEAQESMAAERATRSQAIRQEQQQAADQFYAAARKEEARTGKKPQPHQAGQRMTPEQIQRILMEGLKSEEQPKK